MEEQTAFGEAYRRCLTAPASWHIHPAFSPRRTEAGAYKGDFSTRTRKGEKPKTLSEQLVSVAIAKCLVGGTHATILEEVRSSGGDVEVTG